ncbi:MAG: hypothetical protein VXY99_05010, partial [Pseudomonadota bacterium]|nr:hypothetical protein [Pseudomonadota bacterium]
QLDLKGPFRPKVTLTTGTGSGHGCHTLPRHLPGLPGQDQPIPHCVWLLERLLTLAMCPAIASFFLPFHPSGKK